MGRGRGVVEGPDGVKKQPHAVQGQKIRLDGDDQQIRRHQGVDQHHPGVGRAVEDDVVVGGPVFQGGFEQHSLPLAILEVHIQVRQPRVARHQIESRLGRPDDHFRPRDSVRRRGQEHVRDRTGQRLVKNTHVGRGATVGVEIHDQDPGAPGGQGRAQGQGRGGLAHAAFLVGYGQHARHVRSRAVTAGRGAAAVASLPPCVVSSCRPYSSLL
jgi:hypothetical protein